MSAAAAGRPRRVAGLALCPRRPGLLGPVGAPRVARTVLPPGEATVLAGFLPLVLALPLACVLALALSFLLPDFLAFRGVRAQLRHLGLDQLPHRRTLGLVEPAVAVGVRLGEQRRPAAADR